MKYITMENQNLQSPPTALVTLQKVNITDEVMYYNGNKNTLRNVLKNIKIEKNLLF